MRRIKHHSSMIHPCLIVFAVSCFITIIVHSGSLLV